MNLWKSSAANDYVVNFPLTDLPPHMVKVVDTAGAGDAFVGAYPEAVVEGKTFFEAVTWGNAESALAFTKPGAQGTFVYGSNIIHMV